MCVYVCVCVCVCGRLSAALPGSDAGLIRFLQSSPLYTLSLVPFY